MLAVGDTKENLWATVSPFSEFIRRFNIPAVHGSGIYVDLGRDTEGYREVAGRCPVFGKFIQLHQPSGYSNNFLDDAPTARASSMRPLPGGFNSPQVYTSGQKFSPVEDALLKKKLGASAPRTAVGRCALYAYSTAAVNPKTGATSNYKYPFVYDAASAKCYVLAITAQFLKGQKYCSVNGSPSGLTWACFEPRKESSSAGQFVYGSAFVAEGNPDEWQSSCPNDAVKDALFGKWTGGQCIPFGATNSIEAEPASKKEECWSRVFLNTKVASDAPTTYPETAQNSWNDFWPVHQQSSPKSGGVGANWANFYKDEESGKTLCAIFDVVPDCFVSEGGAVAYNALGSLTEVNLPQCNPDSFIPIEGPCEDCLQTITTCSQNELVQTTKRCCIDPEVSPSPPEPPVEPPEPPVEPPEPPVEPPEPPVEPPEPPVEPPEPPVEPPEPPVEPPEPPVEPPEAPIEPEPEPSVPVPPTDEAGSGVAPPEENGGVNAALIAGGIVGGLMLLGVIGAGVGMYYRKSTHPAADHLAPEVAGGREGSRASDIALPPDQSWWDEGQTDNEALLGSKTMEANY
ncbi:apical membrane antigen 1 protein [Besnoitia besnoiti]|uniref:Apical membrane antigen 1 protein n=1 Tax=Besnoitia besnoiti TaxID=94643 RepID=A0A2A9MBI2_BESBE|nr:apical membrane antigen 1 protein [Besnoitia besnoiti]PFH33671.1 apical membrane antigen 1 protein [Besnoitia besnoiti]